MPTYSATFKRIDSGRNEEEEEKSMEITFYRDCCIGRSNFSASNKKIARKHIDLKFSDDSSQEGPVVMIKSVSKNPAYFWRKLKSDSDETMSDTPLNSDGNYSNADQVSRDEYLPLKSGDKLGVFENSFIYSININKYPTPLSAQSSINLSQKTTGDDDKSLSPTVILSRSEELPDDEDLESETDYGSDTEKETKKDEEEASVTETLEKDSSDVTLQSSPISTKSTFQRKRKLPKWMLLAQVNSIGAESKHGKLGNPRPSRNAAKNRRPVDYEEPPPFDDEDETPAHATRARRASRQEHNSSRTRSGGRATRRSRAARGDRSDEEGGGSAEEYDEDDESERSPLRRREKRAAAVRISSYAESEFVVNDSDFTDSDAEEKAKKRRKTESDEEYEDEPNEANNDSGSDFEISQSPNKSHRKLSSSSPHRKGGHQKSSRKRRSSHGKNRSSGSGGGGSQRSRTSNRNAGKPPSSAAAAPLRRSSRRKPTQSDGEDEEVDEKDEENKYIPRSSTSRSASNSASPTKSPEKSSRQACVYGAKCYRKNALHKKDYSHPGDPDWAEEEEEKPEKRPSRNIRPRQNTDFVNSADEDYYSSGQESEEVNDDDSKDVDYGSRANRNRPSATSKKRSLNQDDDQKEEDDDQEGAELSPSKKRSRKTATLKRSRR